MREIIELAGYLITEFANYLLTYTVLFQSGVTRKKSRWIVGVGSIVAIHYFVLHYWGWYDTTGCSFITMLVVPLFLTERREKKWFALYPFVAMASSVIAVSVSFLVVSLNGMSEYDFLQQPIGTVLCQCVPMIILLGFWAYRKIKGKKPLYVQLGIRQYVLFYIGTICTLIMLGVLQSLSGGRWSENSISQLGLVISVACITFILLIIWQGIVVYRELFYKEQSELSEKMMRQQEEYFEQLMRQDEKMRRFRHDMRAHITVLQSYTEEGGQEEMKEYLSRIVGETALCEGKSYTGNKNVDAIVGQLVNEAEEKEIHVDFRGKLPEETAISVYDLCIVFSNLLKNAVEACEKIHEGEEREIKVGIGSYNDKLLIEIENTTAEEVRIYKNRLETTKSDKLNHGLGSRNVAEIVEKYKGELKYSYENGWFGVEILF